jgi:hypothetical protein
VEAWPTTDGLGMTPNAGEMIRQTLERGRRDLEIR